MTFDYSITHGNLVITTPVYSVFIPLLYFKDARVTVLADQNKKNEPSTKLIFKPHRSKDDYTYTFRGESYTLDGLTEMLNHVYKYLSEEQEKKEVSLI